MISIEPVACFHSSFKEKADAPRQGALSKDNIGVIRFFPQKNFEQAIEDLQGMEKIWVVFWMDRVSGWKAKVQPPRDISKKSVFATRSPHRPNPIGLSCVTLVSVNGLDLVIKDHDLLDQTPVLDIKPYLPYADSFPSAKVGWLEDLPNIQSNHIQWNDISLSQVKYLKEMGEVDLCVKVEARLKSFTMPSTSNRISFLGEGYYLQAYKTWRILFCKEDTEITIQAILSGFDDDGLKNEPLHKEFLKKFIPFFSETFVGKGWVLYNSFKMGKKRG
jgi:tRNA (adenine37-N6)-methyltransferase